MARIMLSLRSVTSDDFCAECYSSVNAFRTVVKTAFRLRVKHIISPHRLHVVLLFITFREVGDVIRGCLTMVGYADKVHRIGCHEW